MLAIEFLFVERATAQADVFVPGDHFLWVHATIDLESDADVLLASTDSSDPYEQHDVWVRPLRGEDAVLDLGFPSYQLVDVNGDGALDPLSNGVDPRSGVTWVTYDPQGDFRFDFDGDGRKDFIGVDSRVAINDGSRFVPLELGWGPGRLLPAGDLDGDGRDDLVRLVYEQPWNELDRRFDAHYELLLGADLREGAWPARWTLDLPPERVANEAVAFLDADGDGALDMVVFFEVSGENEIAIFGDLVSPDGPRELARAARKADGFLNDPEDPPRIENVGDWDGDGDDDVVVHSQHLAGMSRLAILDADLDDPVGIVATFDLREGADPAYGDSPPLGAEFVGDFDGDGDLDLALDRPKGVAFYGVDPDRLAAEPAPPGVLLGGCGAGGGAAGAAGVGLVGIGLRRRRR